MFHFLLDIWDVWKTSRGMGTRIHTPNRKSRISFCTKCSDWKHYIGRI